MSFYFFAGARRTAHWELDIEPGTFEPSQKRLLTRERNRLHERHRAPLGAGGFE